MTVHYDSLRELANDQALEIESLMTTTSGEQGNAGTGEGSAGDETEDLVIGRRGTWGTLWN